MYTTDGTKKRKHSTDELNKVIEEKEEKNGKDIIVTKEIDPSKEEKEKEKEKEDNELILTLKKENKRLKQQLEDLKSLDVIVVWDGEDSLSVRAVTPAKYRTCSKKVLDNIWKYDSSRDSKYTPGARPCAYLAQERRPVAMIYRVKPQMTEEEINLGEPDQDKTVEAYNCPDI